MKRSSIWRGVLGVTAGGLLTLGCSSAPAAKQDPQPTAWNPPPTTAPADPKPADTPAYDPSKVQAQDENARKILEEVAKGRTLQDQQRVSESSALYDQALGFYEKGDFAQAKAAVDAAVEKWPGNLQARKLQGEINSILTGPSAQHGTGGLAEKVREELIMRIEQSQIEITNHIREGERHYQVRDYETALRHFEEAEFKIKNIPYEVPAMAQLLPKLTENIRRTRDAGLAQKRALEEAQKRLAESETQAFELARRREVLEKIAHLLELGYMAFDQKRFDKCIKMCDEILQIDPHYTVAIELKEDAEKVRHREEYYEFIKAKVENWKKLTDQDDEAVIPYSDTVRFPSAEEWAEISKRATGSILQQGTESSEEDPDILAINRSLDTVKIDMLFDNTKLEDVISYVRDFTGLNIVTDQGLGDKADFTKQVTFKVKELPVRNALRLLLGQQGLDFAVTGEKIVLITTPDKAGGKPILELHDIRDILVRIQDFPGPKVELQNPSGGAALTGASFSLEEPKESSVSEDQIVDLIKENIAPGSWESTYTIEKTPNQQLLVNHTPKTHKELREFLGRLRSYTGTMVAVTARFMASFDDFLDDVGVDIINRPPAGGYDITGVGFSDIDEHADAPAGPPGSEVGPGFVTRENARLETYDLRAQTFHTLLRFDPLTRTGIDPMSNRLINQGGLGLQYQWIGEQALQMVLRAVHKRQKATIVQAPRITVFNTQRSHILVQTQIPYISDLEPQISTAAAAYDPVISVLTQGVVLDVRPIVSNDRKYVTLEMRPALAELQTIRSIDINSGGPGGNGTATIQLPWLVLQRAETTVTVPDRGTLMISGFKDILMRDLKSGVPFLQNVPVLNFFFTRKGKTNERKRLAILVTPEIIDLSEHESEQH